MQKVINVPESRWLRMPEGAVEFSLADGDWAFTWYNAEGLYWEPGFKGWAIDHTPDNRQRLKVADHRPIIGRS